MAKYRLLSQEELKELEKEFIDYLVVNGITADAWEEIKKTQKSRANEIIDLFSDVVFEGIMRKVQFLDYRSEKSLKSFQCLDEKMVMVGIDISENSDLNLLDVKDFTKMKEEAPSIKVYTTEKKYSKQRELELFDMTNAGCEISKGELFKSLCIAI